MQAMTEGRLEIQRAQEKLSSSLTTPLVRKEMEVLEKGSWLNESKDLTGRFNLLPPINTGSTIKSKAMAFTVD